MQTVNIEFYQDKNPLVNDAYDRLISKIPLLKQTQGYSLFTVTGCEPGVGSTTIAISIAVSMAKSGWKTLLVDADIRKGADKKRLSADVERGLSEYLSGAAALQDVICETNVTALHYIACGTESDSPVTLLNSEALSIFMKFVAEQYDYVIFDSPSLNTTIDAAIIASKTSGAILVAGYMQTKKAKIEVALRELEQTGANLIGIVLNNVSKKDYRRYIENFDYFMKMKKKKWRSK